MFGRNFDDNEHYTYCHDYVHYNELRYPRLVWMQGGSQRYRHHHHSGADYSSAIDFCTCICDTSSFISIHELSAPRLLRLPRSQLNYSKYSITITDIFDCIKNSRTAQEAFLQDPRPVLRLPRPNQDQPSRRGVKYRYVDDYRHAKCQR